MSRLEEIKKEIRHLKSVKSCFRMAEETRSKEYLKICYRIANLKDEYKKLLKGGC